MIRHTDNKVSEDSINSENDYPLTKEGIRQARELRTLLKDESFDAVFTSLKQRSIQTAEVLCKDRDVKMYKSVAFNEYMLRPDGSGVESTRMGESRTMSKIYSIYEIFEEVAIVAHGSINKTILRSLLNIDYEESFEYFKKYGEIQILRYDYKKGDTKWNIVDSFAPKQ